MIPVGSLGDFGISLSHAQMSSPQASTTSTCTFAVVKIAFGNAVLFVRACRRPLHYLLGLQWEQWDVYIARWSWVSMTVLFHASYQNLTKMQFAPETRFDEVLCCFQVATILAGRLLPEGAQDLQAFSAILLPSVSVCGQNWFKSLWIVATVDQCLCWCLVEQHVPDLTARLVLGLAV